MEGETTRGRNDSGRNDSGRTGKWAKRPVTVVTNLFKEYGYKGTMIITGGLFMNILVAASVMRPPTWFTKKNNIRKKIEVCEKLLETSNQFDTDDAKSNESSKLSKVKLNRSAVHILLLTEKIKQKTVKIKF